MKDAYHEVEVQAARGILIPLAVESLGLESQSSLRAFQRYSCQDHKWK